MLLGFWNVGACGLLGCRMISVWSLSSLKACRARHGNRTKRKRTFFLGHGAAPKTYTLNLSREQDMPASSQPKPGIDLGAL